MWNISPSQPLPKGQWSFIMYCRYVALHLVSLPFVLGFFRMAGQWGYFVVCLFWIKHSSDVASNKESTLHSKDNVLLGVDIHVNIFSFQSVLAL